MTLDAEQRIGNYRLIARIGAGGMGEVWQAEDVRLRRMVAIKILSAAIEQKESNARLLREARTAAQVTHPNIATIYSIEETDEHSFIVMEYIRGVSLADRLASGPLPEPEVLWMARHVADALREAHSHGIIHRDIKPGNVMLTGNRLKILDFGIAKRIGIEQSDYLSQEFVTPEGIVLGTLFYMSPEQAIGKALDARTDLYSLGVVMYQSLSGRLPFAGETTPDTIARIMRDDPPPLRQINPSVSAPVENLINRCLQKNPDDRYADAAELILMLDRLTAAPGTAVPGSTEHPQLVVAPTLPMKAAMESASESAGTPPKEQVARRTGLLRSLLTRFMPQRRP